MIIWKNKALLHVTQMIVFPTLLACLVNDNIYPYKTCVPYIFRSSKLQ